MKLTILGTGYVGLVAGACFAETGNDVTCCDVQKDKINALRKGEIPFYEPGLEDLVKRNTKEGRLTFSDDVPTALGSSEINFVCVGTPLGANAIFDMKALHSATETIGKHAKDNSIVVLKSTVPVGTAKQVREMVEPRLRVASNPEFLKEGNAVEDFMKPDRVIIGTRSDSAAQTLRKLYSPFVRTGNPMLVMDHASAELSKLAANAFLATRISFMNEISRVCELTGADVREVRIGVGTDSRIGQRYLFPGIGYGGSCFPKDVRSLISLAKQLGYQCDLLDSVEAINAEQRTHFVSKIRDYFSGKLSGKKVAIWGLAFKPNTDDVRDAPALTVIEELVKEGAKLSVYDPEGMPNIKELFGDKIEYCENNYDTLQDADALCVLTEWNIFRKPDFKKVMDSMNGHAIFDGRNIYDPHELAEIGFDYFGIGIAQRAS